MFRNNNRRRRRNDESTRIGAGNEQNLFSSRPSTRSFVRYASSGGSTSSAFLSSTSTSICSPMRTHAGPGRDASCSRSHRNSDTPIASARSASRTVASGLHPPGCAAAGEYFMLARARAVRAATSSGVRRVVHARRMRSISSTLHVVGSSSPAAAAAKSSQQPSGPNLS